MNRSQKVGIGFGVALLLALLLVAIRFVTQPVQEPQLVATKPRLATRQPKTAVIPVTPRRFAPHNRMIAMPLAPTNSLPTASEERVYSSTGRATLKEGETLVTGGWALEPGKRVWALITPTVGSVNSQSLAQITFSAQFVSVPDELLSDPFWESLKATDKKNNEAGALAPDYVGTLMDSWENREDVKLLSSPTVTVLDGQEAGMLQADTASFDSKTGKMTHQGGVLLKVQPFVQWDRTLNLDVSVEVSPSAKK